MIAAVPKLKLVLAAYLCFITSMPSNKNSPFQIYSTQELLATNLEGIIPEWIQKLISVRG
jgi:hypothetical protein